MVCASNLSSASKRRTISIPVGTVGLSILEKPVFIAPGNGEIKAVSIASSTGINVGIASGSVSLVRRTAPGANTTVASFPMSNGIVAYEATRVASGMSSTTFSTGDLYTFKNSGLIGVTLTDALMTIEYELSE